ncbi:MAG: lycopene cyclase domain-containing protein, partial [Frankiaceae bacterium]|nr:lycopene cyclase domain-containing protein [Frankiaceae bacterium]
AIHAGHWRYRHLLGLRIGNVPVEEIAFFLVVPACSILTLEAVWRRRPGWRIGDEAP